MKLLETNMRNAAVSLVLVMCVVGIVFAEDESASEGIGIDVTADFNSAVRIW
jgi:hypothetical protein